MKTVLAVLAIFASYSAFGAELVKRCDLGGRPSEKIAVVRDSKIASTYVYYIQQGKVRKPFFGDRDQSRGADVRVECVGKKSRVLIVSGEFTANALQGFAIASLAGADAPDRLDFAEKGRPSWLYLAPNEMAVVFETLGYGDSDAKYVAYRRAGGQDQVEGVDQPPSQEGFDVVDLRPSRKKQP